MDEHTTMAHMDAWLDQVCTELAVDREAMRHVQPDLLALIRDVAHGPSRPGAPLTAFLLGVAAGRDGGDLVPGTRERIAAVLALLDAAPITDTSRP